MPRKLIRARLLRAAVFALIMAFGALLATEDVQAANDICVPVPDPVTGGHPDLDGLITGDRDDDGDDDSDVGWTGGSTFMLGADTGVENSVRFHIANDASFIYLGFDIHPLAGGLTGDDRIVIGISPSAPTAHVPADDILLIVQPWGQYGAVNANVVGPPFAVLAFKNSAGWGQQNLVAPTKNVADSGSWPFRRARVWKNSTATHWGMEMWIPRKTSTSFGTDTTQPQDNQITGNEDDGGIRFSAADQATPTFRIYVNVVRTSFGDVVTEAPWPPSSDYEDGNEMTVETLDAPSTPGPAEWAPASHNASTQFTAPRAACAGLYFARYEDIGTTNSPTSAIRLYRPNNMPLTAAQCTATALANTGNNTNTTNTFQAQISNSGTKGPMNADPRVRVRFKVATWGIPPEDLDDWNDVCPPGMPGETCDLQNVAPNRNPWSTLEPVPVGVRTKTLTVQYLPTHAESCLYLPPNDHQCMAAIMESPDPGVQFLNNSSRRNMDFVTTSLYERGAKIDMRGYEAPPGRPLQLLLVVTSSVRRINRIFLDRNTIVGAEIVRDAAILKRLGPGVDIKRPLIEFDPGVVQPRVAPATPTVQPAQPSTVKPQPAQPSATVAAGATVLPGRPVVVQRGSAVLRWLTRGYLRTGRYLNIAGRKYEHVREIGGYGYEAIHRGPFAGWRSQMTVSQLQLVKGTSNMYSTTVMPNDRRYVNVRLESIAGPAPQRIPTPITELVTPKPLPRPRPRQPVPPKPVLPKPPDRR